MSKFQKESSKRSYVAVAPFHNDFFKYVMNWNPVTLVRTGDITQKVDGANSSNCPKGRVLRENGKKLFPDANSGVSTLMVGVFDNQSMLSGFIDPNSPLFQV